MTSRGAGRPREAIAHAQSRRSQSRLRKGTRAADRIAEGDRITPLHRQGAVVHHGSAPHGAAGSAIADLEHSSRDRGCSRVGVIPAQDLGGVPALDQRSATTRSIGQRSSKGCCPAILSDREGVLTERDRGGGISRE